MRQNTWQAGLIVGAIALGSATAWGEKAEAVNGGRPAAPGDALVVTAPIRLTYAFGGDNTTMVSLTQIHGTYTAPLDGELTLLLMDRNVPVASATHIPLSVRDAFLIGSGFAPPSNIVPDPLVMHLDPGRPSYGWFHPGTGSVFIALYVVNGCWQAPSQMPIYLRGHLTRTRLDVRGCSNDQVADDQICLGLHGRRSFDRKDIRFSTEITFPVAGDNTGSVIEQVSDGDLLSESVCVLRTAEELAGRLGIMPPTPDLGLDAVTLTAYTPIFFSTEDDVFSETLGPLSDGDLLSVRGQVVRYNGELLAEFGGMPSIGGFGLDAVHVKTSLFSFGNVADCCGDILFSIETSFWSETQGRIIGHGDLLCEDGTVVRTNRQLLANFHPIAVECTEPNCPNAEIPCPSASTDERCRDLGLDGLAVLPHGEILFSVERSFRDANLGWVSDGDVLSTRGVIIRKNLDLVDTCEPLIDIANFGLDALDVIGRAFVNSPADAAPVVGPAGATAP